MGEHLLTPEAVTDRTTLSRSDIRRRVKDGKFPAPIALGYKKIAWVASEVDAWIEATVKEARTQCAE